MPPIQTRSVSSNRAPVKPVILAVTAAETLASVRSSPSGEAVTTSLITASPPAPGLLTTTTVAPRRAARGGASRRASVS